MRRDAAPTGKRGRRPTYGDAAVQTSLTMKALFGMALRQTTGFVESLLKLVGLDWTVPDFSTLSRRQKPLAVNIPYRGSRGPLHLLVDSTGIKVEGEGEWHARKHGGWRCCKSLIPEDSLRESKRLNGPHEQAIPHPLSHDELVQLQRIALQAGIAADLGRQGDDLARVA